MFISEVAVLIRHCDLHIKRDPELFFHTTTRIFALILCNNAADDDDSYMVKPYVRRFKGQGY